MMDTSRVEPALRLRLPEVERVKGCERLSGGASRETYRIDAVVLGRPARFALRRQVPALRQPPGPAHSLATEADLLDAAAAAGVPAPRVLARFRPEDGLEDAILLEWVEGETLGGRIARSAAYASIRPRLARQCGEILGRLHQIETGGRLASLPRVSPEACVRETHAAYVATCAHEPMIDFTARWLLDHLPADRPHTLVHGDFRNGNLMVDPERGVVAVLDWELAHVGDPVRDLGWLCTASWRFGGDQPVGGFGTIEDLLCGYQAATGLEIASDHLRFWRVFGSFWWSVATLTMAAASRDGAEPGPERPMIGRRSSEAQIDCVNLLIPGLSELPASQPRTLSATNLPTSIELAASVRDFLRSELSTQLEGRSLFLARVCANAVDTLIREIEFGASVEATELASIEALLGATAMDRRALRERLCLEIRSGGFSLDDPRLHAHLRLAVLGQARIDQPDYAGVREAMAR
jgi:aminoglycoside phosphotransferase (APT) family kinase protein